MTDDKKEILIERMRDNLKILRLKLDVSQEQLASLVGTSRFTIMALENKTRKMTWSTFLSLLLIFTKNPETDKMLSLFEIYTDELNDALKLRNTQEWDKNWNEKNWFWLWYNK